MYLDRHLLSHQSVIKKYLCPICRQPCESRSNLKTHGRTKHNVVLNNEEMIEAEFKNSETNNQIDSIQLKENLNRTYNIPFLGTARRVHIQLFQNIMSKENFSNKY